MGRPWRPPRSSTHQEWYSSPYGVTIPRRPVILYVDLRGIPDIMATMSLPEAYTLTRDNIPDLTEAEEEAILTYMTHFRYERLGLSIRSWKTSTITSIELGIHMYPIILFASLLLSTKLAPTSTCAVRILFGTFFTLIDRGGLANRTLKMAPDHAFETQMPHSFFGFGPFALFTLGDHPD